MKNLHSCNYFHIFINVLQDKKYLCIHAVDASSQNLWVHMDVVLLRRIKAISFSLAYHLFSSNCMLPLKPLQKSDLKKDRLFLVNKRGLNSTIRFVFCLREKGIELVHWEIVHQDADCVERMPANPLVIMLMAVYAELRTVCGTSWYPTYLNNLMRKDRGASDMSPITKETFPLHCIPHKAGAGLLTRLVLFCGRWGSCTDTCGTVDISVHLLRLQKVQIKVVLVP